MAALAPGPLITIANGSLSVQIAPAAGGRIAQIARDGIEWLVGHGEMTSAAIEWGSYAMVPWAGRIRRGHFDFHDRGYELPLNHDGHAIHGVAFTLPWRVDAHSHSHADLSLALPVDERWPFGGSSRQRIEIGENSLKMMLSVTAGEQPMPACIGWHPWFRKPDQVGFAPSRMYPRDEEGIATHPLAEPSPGPWDDCFINDQPVLIQYGGQRLRLTSDCSNWVVYDELDYATCFEPQSGPPDAFNLAPRRLEPGATLEAWFLLEWL